MFGSHTGELHEGPSKVRPIYPSKPGGPEHERTDAERQLAPSCLQSNPRRHTPRFHDDLPLQLRKVSRLTNALAALHARSDQRSKDGRHPHAVETPPLDFV